MVLTLTLDLVRSRLERDGGVLGVLQGKRLGDAEVHRPILLGHLEWELGAIRLAAQLLLAAGHDVEMAGYFALGENGGTLRLELETFGKLADRLDSDITLTILKHWVSFRGGQLGTAYALEMLRGKRGFFGLRKIPTKGVADHGSLDIHDQRTGVGEVEGDDDIISEAEFYSPRCGKANHWAGFDEGDMGNGLAHAGLDDRGRRGDSGFRMPTYSPISAQRTPTLNFQTVGSSEEGVSRMRVNCLAADRRAERLGLGIGEGV